MPAVNELAPDFTLLYAKGESVTLSSLRGKKVVLLFLPGAFTGVCTKEVCAIQEDLSAFTGQGAEVLGISVDGIFANMAFKEANKLTFPILSDHTRATVQAYGVAWPNFGGMTGYTAANRAVFVLDREGRVTWRWIGENPGAFPPLDEVKAAIAR